MRWRSGVMGWRRVVIRRLLPGERGAWRRDQGVTPPTEESLWSRQRTEARRRSGGRGWPDRRALLPERSEWFRSSAIMLPWAYLYVSLCWDRRGSNLAVKRVVTALGALPNSQAGK